LLEAESIHHFEGTTGVKNLAKVARLLGYIDTQRFGYFDGGCYGDLINFLEDNPGACEAIIDWIRDNQEVWDLTEDEEEEEDNDEDEEDEED
jgi:hypothetical protein